MKGTLPTRALHTSRTALAEEHEDFSHDVLDARWHFIAVGASREKKSVGRLCSQRTVRVPMVKIGERGCPWDINILSQQHVVCLVRR